MNAFPYNPTFNPEHNGMGLRDYFAAKAMQGLLSTVKDEEWFMDETAGVAYQMADAMMEARK